MTSLTIRAAVFTLFCSILSFSLSGQTSNGGVIDSLLMELEKGNQISGSVIEIGDINFETGKFHLKDDAKMYAQKIAKFLILVPTLDAKIEGHSDNVGSDRLNDTLSLNRAKSVRDELISNSVDRVRLSVAGFGSSRPKESNATKEGRSANRRVEITFEKHVSEGEEEEVVTEQNLIVLKDGRRIGASKVEERGDYIYYQGYLSSEWKYFLKSLVSSVQYTNGRTVGYSSSSPQSSSGTGHSIVSAGGIYAVVGYRTFNAPAGVYQVEFVSENGVIYRDTLDFGGRNGGFNYNLGLEIDYVDRVYLQIGFSQMTGLKSRSQGLHIGMGLIIGKKVQFRPGLMIGAANSKIPLKKFEPDNVTYLTIDGKVFDPAEADVKIANRATSLMPQMNVDIPIKDEWLNLRISVGAYVPISSSYVLEFSGSGYDKDDQYESRKAYEDISGVTEFTYNGDDYRGKGLELGGINYFAQIGIVLRFDD
ncbi:OmpA family protein [Owenweeksia hongkongensis]|uniref:OmpA family protein n=1 Tax=Owenweeksia hongkongensis TaxID=253245 RepID=UPI003A933FDE